MTSSGLLSWKTAPRTAYSMLRRFFDIELRVSLLFEWPVDDAPDSIRELKKFIMMVEDRRIEVRTM